MCWQRGESTATEFMRVPRMAPITLGKRRHWVWAKPSASRITFSFHPGWPRVSALRKNFPGGETGCAMCAALRRLQAETTRPVPHSKPVALRCLHHRGDVCLPVFRQPTQRMKFTGLLRSSVVTRTGGILARGLFIGQGAAGDPAVPHTGYHEPLLQFHGCAARSAANYETQA